MRTVLFIVHFFFSDGFAFCVDSTIGNGARPVDVLTAAQQGATRVGDEQTSGTHGVTSETATPAAVQTGPRNVPTTPS